MEMRQNEQQSRSPRVEPARFLMRSWMLTPGLLWKRRLQNSDNPRQIDVRPRESLHYE